MTNDNEVSVYCELLKYLSTHSIGDAAEALGVTSDTIALWLRRDARTPACIASAVIQVLALRNS
jgi:transposase